MNQVTLVSLGRLAGLAAIAFLGGAVGCAPATQQLQTGSYTLSHPDFWNVKQTAKKDGEPTIVTIPQYGAAVIDQGSGAMASKGENYDAVTADVEVRLYSWPDEGAPDPSQAVGKLLVGDQELALQKQFAVPVNPPECGTYARKYTLFGVPQTPIDLVSPPGSGYRTIIVGGRGSGHLVGAVARVEYGPDAQRNCHNLSNLQVQLQNLLDGLSTSGGAPAAGGGPPAAGNGGPPAAGGGTQGK